MKKPNRMIKRLFLSLFICIIGCSSVCAKEIKEGFYNIICALDENKVVDVKNASCDNTANIQIYQNNGTMAQIFYISKSDNDYYEIISASSKKVLDVQNSETAPKTNVWQYESNKTDAQKWKFIPADNDFYYIRSKLGDLNLDVEEAKTDNGTNIQIYPSNGTKAQKFKLKKVDIEKNFLKNNKLNYDQRITWVKDYLLDHYIKLNIKKMLIIGDKNFQKSCEEIFKTQDKFSFQFVNSFSDIKNINQYDMILNNKYNATFCSLVFKNISVENMGSIYPEALYQTTIDYLNKNNIPIYFFNAPQRSQLKNMSDEEKKLLEIAPSDKNLPNNMGFLNKIYGNNDRCKNYILDNYYSKGLNIIKIKNHLGLADCRGKYFNIVNGRRVTLSNPNNYKNIIHMYGPCTVNGRYVSDEYTIPNFIQQKININDKSAFLIENNGVVSNPINDFEYILDTEFKPGDIVIVERQFDNTLKKVIHRNKCFYQELSPIFNRPHNWGLWMVNGTSHINHNGNRAIADFMYKTIKSQIDKNIKEKHEDKTINFHSDTQSESSDTFIKENPEFLKFLDNLKDLSKDKRNKNYKIGSLNVNCNPFTLGHRYLIEESLKRVDHLYLFVVEEDASEFSFKDRYEMVKRGVADLPNVTVLKTGKWMCSKFTFPDYFDKDNLQDKVLLNPTKDIDLYGKYIAPALGATIRFAGEEPLDLITRQHNNFMKNKLPKYGITFCEIPRKTLSDGQVISASKVRKYLKEKKYDEMKKFLPKTTYDYLIEHFA